MAERALGLDVGTSSVRVVEVVLSSPPSVSRVGEVPLPPGAVRDGEVVDAAAVGAAITELWRQTGLRSKDVRVGLSGPKVVVRLIEMPAMPDDELAGAVRFSASDHIPIPLDEAVLDHAVLEALPPAEPGGPPQVRVLIAAAYRSSLDALLAAVAAGGLRAVGVDLIPFAVVRALNGPSAPPAPPVAPAGDDGDVPAGPGPEALVSVGAGLTTVIVHENGLPRFVRTVAAGGDLLTGAIADEMGIPTESAEATKREIGDASDEDAEDLVLRAARVVELRLSGILGEIQSSLAYWVSQSDRPLRRVVLTGGGLRAGDVPGRLSLLLGAPVEWGSVAGLAPPERALGSGDWADLTVAAGLALGAADAGWQIDLCPAQRRKLTFDRQMAVRLGAVAAVTVAVLGGLSVRSVLGVRHVRHELAVQQKANHKVEAELARYDSLRRLNSDLEASRSRVKTALNGDVSWTRFMSEFVKDMPDGVWIQSLNATAAPTRARATTVPVAASVAAKTKSSPGSSPSGGAAGAAAPAPAGTGIGTVQWTASALDYPAVADWLRDLAKDPALSGVTVGALSQTQVGNRTIVNFTSTASITPAARSDRASQLAKASL